MKALLLSLSLILSVAAQAGSFSDCPYKNMNRSVSLFKNTNPAPKAVQSSNVQYDQRKVDIEN